MQDVKKCSFFSLKQGRELQFYILVLRPTDWYKICNIIYFPYFIYCVDLHLQAVYIIQNYKPLCYFPTKIYLLMYIIKRTMCFFLGLHIAARNMQYVLVEKCQSININKPKQIVTLYCADRIHCVTFQLRKYKPKHIVFQFLSEIKLCEQTLYKQLNTCCAFKIEKKVKNSKIIQYGSCILYTKC